MAINILYYLILLLFLLFSSLELLEKETSINKKLVFLFLSIILIFFCGLRPLNLDKNLQLYRDFFNSFCSFINMIYNNGKITNKKISVFSLSEFGSAKNIIN